MSELLFHASTFYSSILHCTLSLPRVSHNSWTSSGLLSWLILEFFVTSPACFRWKVLVNNAINSVVCFCCGLRTNLLRWCSLLAESRPSVIASSQNYVSWAGCACALPRYYIGKKLLHGRHWLPTRLWGDRLHALTEFLTLMVMMSLYVLRLILNLRRPLMPGPAPSLNQTSNNRWFQPPAIAPTQNFGGREGCTCALPLLASGKAPSTPRVTLAAGTSL